MAGYDSGAANQKNSCLDSSGAEEIGRRPAYDSPTSKSTSGIAEPLTTNSIQGDWSEEVNRNGCQSLLWVASVR